MFVDVMQYIGCRDSAALAANNTDVTVSVVRVTEDGRVTVDINMYDSLYYSAIIWIEIMMIALQHYQWQTGSVCR